MMCHYSICIIYYRRSTGQGSIRDKVTIHRITLGKQTINIWLQ